MAEVKAKIERALDLLDELEDRIKKLGTGRRRIKKGDPGFQSPGEVVRQIREILGFSPVQFAFHAGISPQALNKWEKDEVIPKLESLGKLRYFLREEKESTLIWPRPFQEWVIPATYLKTVTTCQKPTLSMLYWLREMEERAGFPLDEEACRVLLERYEKSKGQESQSN